MLSLGAPAEYGNLQGAVFNIVTKQGSNTWHGDLNYYNQSDADLAQHPASEECDADDDCLAAGATLPPRQYHDFTAQLSGPIVKDKLWFFGSYQFQKDVFSPVGVPAEFPSRSRTTGCSASSTGRSTPSTS